MADTTITNPYLEPVEDGLPMRDSGQWVIEKMHYINKYIFMFTTAMYGKPWRNIRYIDLFAGPGKCKVRDSQQIILGSPLLAVTANKPFSDFIFADLNGVNIEALERRCKSLGNSSNFSYSIGDSNQLVNSIVQDINMADKVYIKGKWWSLNMAVLDPEGLELEWQTVEALAKVQAMDLIIHYSQSGLTRTMKNCISSDEDTVVDRFFGDRHWRNIYTQQRKKGASYARIHRELIDYYKNKLAGLGYVDVVQQDFGSEPVIKNTKDAPLYRLLFASKHKLGNKFWNEVTKRDVYGQGRLL